MKHLLLALMLSIAAGCATVSGPAGPAPSPTSPPYDAWSAVLKEFVDEQGRVDFRGLAANRAELDRFVAWIYAHSPTSDPALFRDRSAVLAFHLNAYNALSMYNVIESGFPHTLAGFAKVRFFYLTRLQVGRQPISLYDYENKVIRAIGEARIHFALNCMAVGCPALPREPFRAESREAELEREAITFMNDARHVRIDEAARTVWLSEIFDFFPEDFLAQAPSLSAYVNRYRTIKVPEDYAVRFMPYDWTVNAQPPTPRIRPSPQ